MSFRKKHWVLGASILAASALIAGCGGSDDDDEMEPVTPQPVTPQPVTPPPVAPMNIISLPDGHGIPADVDKSFMLDPGGSHKAAGVRFYCPGGEDAMGCTITLTPGADGVTATFDEDGGTAFAELLDDAGGPSIANLAVALLDDDVIDDQDTTDPADDVTTYGALSLLRMGTYHDVDDIVDGDNPDTTDTETDFDRDSGGGVTSSLTTHDEPDMPGQDDTGTGVSEIAVSVTAESIPNMDSDTMAVITILDGAPTDDENGTEEDPTDGFDQLRDPYTVMSPVMDRDGDGEIDDPRTSNFTASATWENNPAAEWMTDPALMGAEDNMDMDTMDMWTNYFQAMQALPGGRTLHLDLRSDHNANMMNLMAPQIIARGPDSDDTNDELRVPWSAIHGLDAPLGTEVNLGGYDADEVPAAGAEIPGVDGSYMGVMGRFSCVDATTGDGQGICRINHHESGQMSVSEDDQVVFRPYQYIADADWLAAGVWLTIPDDVEEGDYAIGAFVFGNDPYKPTASDADGLGGADATGMTATYSGQAFGRYAENTGGPMEVGRFTADAVLTANFNGSGGDVGTINGDLTAFMAHQMVDGEMYSEAESTWDVNFESAMIMHGVDGDVAMFNSGASGHSRGHGMTGYWNGQFYGTPATGATGADTLPGSAAGTFGLTTERDNDDNYSLTMGGAFAADRDEPEMDDM